MKEPATRQADETSFLAVKAKVGRTQTRLSFRACELKLSSLVEKTYGYRIKTQPRKWSGDNLRKEKDGKSAKKLERCQTWEECKESDGTYFTKV